MTIYISAFYFALTTMTSVGYGDIITHNNAERIFTVCLQFIGAIIFAMVIAQITAVVSTMDTNARKTAEQLDAVTSFVEVRQFPDALGRRIRRHFRHFYSLKSAIDESKIFSELSTTLRREVSAYLVSELMGADSFFSTMPPMLWPRLLPLLRPTRFEKTELVAVQGEECAEMYVLLGGQMTGELVAPNEFVPRVRHITPGGSVNVLAVLGVWTKCVESVVCDTEVEAYAVVSADFRALFTADSDVLAFEKMQRNESRNFKMDTAYLEAPFGQPLYFVCFAKVEFTLVQAKGLLSVEKLAKARRRSNSLSESEGASWLVADLVDKASGKPFPNGTAWRHQTARAPLKPAAAAPDAAHGGVDMADEPYWGEEVLWGDVWAPFDRAALRVRLFFEDFGLERLLGKVLVPLDGAYALAQTAAGDGGAVASSGAGLDRKLATLEESAALRGPSRPGTSLLPLRSGEVEAWYELRSAEGDAAASQANPSSAAPSEAAGEFKQADGALAASKLELARLPAAALGQGGPHTRRCGAVQLRVRAEPPEFAPTPKPSQLKKEAHRQAIRSSKDLELNLQQAKKAAAQEKKAALPSGMKI
jgi:hypothetical protein